MKLANLLVILTFSLSSLLISCNENVDELLDNSQSDSDNSTPEPQPQSYTLGGSVSGLVGTVVLQNNSGDDISITSDGVYEFDSALSSGATYLVTILTQPTGQICEAANSSGTASDNISNVDINCVSAKVMFVTAATFSGNLGGIAGADAKCDAELAGSKAFITADARRACTTANCSGGAAENSDWVMAPETPYSRVDGTIIAVTNSAAIFESFENSIGENFDTFIHGGFFNNWTNSINTDCANWTVSGGDNNSLMRKELTSITNTLYAGTGNCTTPYPLLCVEQ